MKKLNKKLIAICSILIFLFLFRNVGSTTKNKDLFIITCFILIISIISALIIAVIVAIVEKILS